MTSPSAGPWTGPWAEDARRIYAILQEHDGSHEEPCPLCQARGFVHRSGPELLDRVAELAAGLAATLRATGPEPGAPNSPEPAGPATAPPVTVPIDVSD